MKAIILIDKFKGTLSSNTLGKLTKDILASFNVEANYYPLSDGGDGFLDLVNKDISYINGIGGLKEKIKIPYILKDEIAYLETSKIFGLSMYKKEQLDIYKASSFGLGKLIIDLYFKGARKFYIGLGGTMVNDGGKGMLEALGFSFNNKVSYNKIIPLEKLKFIGVSDVTNPLLGLNGATYVYSEQKGANEKDLKILENNMANYASLINNYLNKNYTNYLGAGAAGGLGFALISLLNGYLIPGIDFAIETLDLKNKLKEADLLITGEGKIDEQSLNGKVVFTLAKLFNKKTLAFCGINELKDNYENVKIISIVPKYASLEESLKDPIKYFKLMLEETFNKQNV